MPNKGQQPPVHLVVLHLSLPFCVICALASFYLGPVALLLIVLLVLMQGVLVADVFDRRHESLPFLLALWVISAICAVYVGSMNFHKVYGPYKLASKGRDRHVPSNATASQFLDGRALTFDDSFVLDDVRAVGFRAYGGTYCAAPVVSQKAVEALGDYPTVQFWAVGQDCCGPRAQFVCDDAGELAVHGGVVLHDPAEWETMMGAVLSPRLFAKGWHKAIEMSCALHEMQTARNPVLLAWVKNPSGVLKWWQLEAVFIWFGASLAQLIAVWVTWTTVIFCLGGGVRGRKETHFP